jgi:anti-sigma-K factor RskA
MKRIKLFALAISLVLALALTLIAHNKITRKPTVTPSKSSAVSGNLEIVEYDNVADESALSVMKDLQGDGYSIRVVDYNDDATWDIVGVRGMTHVP